ncbi:MAG: GC-type dockerin domain-anchored protein [Planctomycetota bacterium]
MRLENCTIVGNTGGLAGAHLGSAIYVNSTVADNVGVQAELGLAPARITDSVVVTRGLLPTVVAAVGQDPADSEIVSSYSLVPADAQGTSTSTLVPMFVRAPSDGGDGWGDDLSTPDFDESLNDDFGDLRLRPGSPAIDSGSRGIMRFFERDADGNPRLRDDPGVPDAGRNGLVDLGAYEFQGVTCLADVNGDGLVSPADFTAWVSSYNAGGSLADQNRDGRVSPQDFTAWVVNYNAGCP